MSEFTGKDKILFHLKNLIPHYVKEGGYRTGDLKDLNELIRKIANEVVEIHE